MEHRDIKKINFTLWETDTIHPYWAECLSKSCDELWLPGDFNFKVFKSSLLKTEFGQKALEKIKIKKILTPFQESSYKEVDPTFSIKDSSTGAPVDSDTFCFYFISQWSERKNFIDLMDAYWGEFGANEKVRLVLKTYINNHSDQEKVQINSFFQNILKGANSQDVAPVSVVHRVLSKAEMNALHKKCQCYVNPSRGEGLGLGALEAAYFGNPVITHTFGEQSTYFHQSNSFIYGHSLRPVKNMGSPWYNIKQNWAQPDIQGMKKAMREVFENKDKPLVTDKVEYARKTLAQYGDPKEVVKSILEALK